MPATQGDTPSNSDLDTCLGVNIHDFFHVEDSWLSKKEDITYSSPSTYQQGKWPDFQCSWWNGLS